MFNLSKMIAAVLVVVAVLLAGYAFVLGDKPTVPVTQAGANEKAEIKVQQYPVVITTRLVRAGQAMQAADLRVALLSINPAGASGDAAQLVGQVPAMDLHPDTPVLSQQLAAGLAMQIAPGERAIAVKVDEVSGVANLVRPGDFVDVFFALRRDNGEVDQSQARMLMSKKRVLAFGHLSLDGPTLPDGKTPAPVLSSRVEPARTAVLAIPVDEINPLLLAENNGRLSLALRHPADEAVPTPELFAAWPTVLRAAVTKDAEGRRTAATSVRTLEGLDLATAGLSMETLAQGNGAQRLSSGRLPRVPTVRTVRQPAAPEHRQNIEVIRGKEVASVQLP